MVDYSIDSSSIRAIVAEIYKLHRVIVPTKDGQWVGIHLSAIFAGPHADLVVTGAPTVHDPERTFGIVFDRGNFRPAEYPLLRIDPHPETEKIRWLPRKPL